MRIALVDGSPKVTLYPLPLLKLGAWRKSMGDDCELFSCQLPAAGDFDEIWITTRFTYDIPFAVGMVREAKKRAKRVWVGGISATLLPEHFEREGVEVHGGLLPEAEEFAPDYSLLDEIPKYSISHTSRGCVRRCKFCMVHRLEPEFYHRPDWERDLYPTAKKLLFYDNNWTAKKRADQEEDVAKLQQLVKNGQITTIDFNQGMDASLMTEDLADLMQGLPIKPIRFAFDGMYQDGHYQRAVEMMAARGFRSFMTYVLYNFRDTPQDFYYRLRESVRLTEELSAERDSFPMRYQPILEADQGREFVGKHWTGKKKKGFMSILSSQSMSGQISAHGAVVVKSFPMRYQPILDVDSRRDYVGEHWTDEGKRNFRVMLSSHSGSQAGGGLVCALGGGEGMTPMQEFEYWFGKDADEFDRLLSYPKVRELMRRKKGALRMLRARAAQSMQSLAHKV